MRGIGSEALELFKGLFDAGKHGIEDAREMPEFVLGVLNREAFVQAFRINLLGAKRHFGDRVERAAHDFVTCESSACEDQWRSKKQNEHRFLELAPYQVPAVANSNEDCAALQIIFAADENNWRSIGHSCGAAGVPAFTLAGKRRPTDSPVAQPFIAIKNCSIRAENFEEAFLDLFPIRVVVKVFAHINLAVI